MLSHSLFLHTLLFYTNLGIQTSKKFLIIKTASISPAVLCLNKAIIEKE